MTEENVDILVSLVEMEGKYAGHATVVGGSYAGRVAMTMDRDTKRAAMAGVLERLAAEVLKETEELKI